MFDAMSSLTGGGGLNSSISDTSSSGNHGDVSYRFGDYKSGKGDSQQSTIMIIGLVVVASVYMLTKGK